MHCTLWSCICRTQVIRNFFFFVFLAQSTQLVLLLLLFADYYYNNAQVKLPSYVSAFLFCALHPFHSRFYCHRSSWREHSMHSQHTLRIRTIKYATVSQFVVFLSRSPIGGEEVNRKLLLFPFIAHTHTRIHFYILCFSPLCTRHAVRFRCSTLSVRNVCHCCIVVIAD